MYKKSNTVSAPLKSWISSKLAKTSYSFILTLFVRVSLNKPKVNVVKIMLSLIKHCIFNKCFTVSVTLPFNAAGPGEE